MICPFFLVFYYVKYDTIKDGEKYTNPMQKMSTKTRRFVANQQYNFDTCYFVRLGREIPRIIENPKEYSEFFS